MIKAMTECKAAIVVLLESSEGETMVCNTILTFNRAFLIIYLLTTGKVISLGV